MRLAGQRGQCFRRLVQIAGLVKDPASEGQRLVGAEAVGVWPLRTRGERLGSRQLEGHVLQASRRRQDIGVRARVRRR